MPYYIEVCLLRSLYCVTLAALLARTRQIVSGRFSQIRSHIFLSMQGSYTTFSVQQVETVSYAS